MLEKNETKYLFKKKIELIREHFIGGNNKACLTLL